MRSALLAALFAVATGVVADVHVELRLADDATRCMQRGVLTATPVDAESADQQVRVPLQPDVSRYVLPLSATRLWRVGIDQTAQCWAPTVTINPETQQTVAVPVHRTGTVTGTMVLRDDRPPATIAGTIFLGAAPHVTAEGAPVQCTLEFPEWSCQVPSTALDLRLDLSGFAPLYCWDVLARPGEQRRCGEYRLRRGATIAGWVRDASGRPANGARVTALPAEEPGPRSARIAARQHTAITNTRGFFQLTELGPGQYRLVSRFADLSPVVLPTVSVEEGEALTWPRMITHQPFATLDITLEPHVGTDGAPWTIELVEKVPTEARPARIEQPADPQGRWSRERLVSGPYAIHVRDRRGSVLARRDVDLSEGGTASLLITMPQILIRGRVLVGGEPLAAKLELSNTRGEHVAVSTSEEGTFDAALPSTGAWTPTIITSAGRSGARTRIAPFTIPGEPDQPHEVEIRVPGGRIRGTVVGRRSGEAVVVHAFERKRLVAQQVTDADGTFDLIGLEPGVYALDAQAESGSTANAVEVRLDEDASVELRLVIEPYRVVRGRVLGLNGAPATGAVVRVSIDDGVSWHKTVTDVHGEFRYNAPGGVAEVSLAVLTYSLPSVLLRVPTRAAVPLTIALPPMGGILHVRGVQRALIQTPDVLVPVNALHFPEPFGAHDGGVHLAPGQYVVCGTVTSGRDCRPVTITPGGRHVVDFRPSTNAREDA